MLNAEAGFSVYVDPGAPGPGVRLRLDLAIIEISLQNTKVIPGPGLVHVEFHYTRAV